MLRSLSKEEEAFAKTIINGLGILEDAFIGKNTKALAADKQLSGAFALIFILLMVSL